MRRGILLAWLVGLGIISWRDVRVNHGPPIPGQLLGASGLFALLSLLAEYEPAAGLAAMLGWGFDLAAILNILPGGLGGPKPGQAAAKPGTAPAAPAKQPAKPAGG